MNRQFAICGLCTIDAVPTSNCKAVAHTFGTSNETLLTISNNFQHASPHSYQFSCHGNRVIDVLSHSLSFSISISPSSPSTFSPPSWTRRLKCSLRPS
eukprot:sb/3478859/